MEVSGNDFVDVNWDMVLRYDPETITIPANDFREVPATASWVEFLTVTGTDNLRISFNGRTYQPLEVGLILKAPRNKAFRRLFIANPSGVANTVKVSKGLGDFDDARLTITSASILNVNPVPAAYSGRFDLNSVIGAPQLNTVVVAGGANTNGVMVVALCISCGADPTALGWIADSFGVLALIRDSQVIGPVAGFVVPTGQAFSVSTIGLVRVTGTFRIL